MRLRSQDDFDAALSLMEVGRSDTDIARPIGIPRPTVSAWRHGRGSRYHHRLRQANRGWRPAAPEAYAYLLGVYLGDGCIAVNRTGAACLVIVLDARYPGVVAEVAGAIAEVFPDTPVGVDGRPGAKAVRANHPCLPLAFPQHAEGPKHLREIVLTDWQSQLTKMYPRQLLRGLIHSDGCRAINRFETKLPSGRVGRYEYPRYFFSNLSADIRGIFCAHCELLGIRWTQSNPRNVSVSHRHSVAILDEFVGPKY
jgi:hypothetical protein